MVDVSVVNETSPEANKKKILRTYRQTFIEAPCLSLKPKSKGYQRQSILAGGLSNIQNVNFGGQFFSQHEK